MARKQKNQARWRTPAIVGGFAALVGSGLYAVRRRRSHATQTPAGQGS